MMKRSTTADDIVTCARSLIAAGGYNGFSYADIAEVVGIRKASIHHHFPSKVELVQTLVAQYREAAEEGLGKLASHVTDPVARLRSYVEYWEACLGDVSAAFCVCAMLASELPILPEAVALEVRAYFRFLSGWMAEVLEQASAQGLVRLAQPAAQEAEIFMATAHGALLSARAYGEPAIFGAIMRSQLERLTAA